MVAPIREKLQKYHYTGVTWEKNLVGVITQDTVIEKAS